MKLDQVGCQVVPNEVDDNVKKYLWAERSKVRKLLDAKVNFTAPPKMILGIINTRELLWQLSTRAIHYFVLDWWQSGMQRYFFYFKLFLHLYDFDEVHFYCDENLHDNEKRIRRKLLELNHFVLCYSHWMWFVVCLCTKCHSMLFRNINVAVIRGIIMIII